MASQKCLAVKQMNETNNLKPLVATMAMPWVYIYEDQSGNVLIDKIISP